MMWIGLGECRRGQDDESGGSDESKIRFHNLISLLLLKGLKLIVTARQSRMRFAVLSWILSTLWGG
jgi:hypothetical protein